MNENTHENFNNFYHNPNVLGDGNYGSDLIMPVDMAYDRLPMESMGSDNVPLAGGGIHPQYPFQQTKMNPQLQEMWDQSISNRFVNNDGRSRFVPASRKPEYVHAGMGRGVHFNTDAKLGPVTTMFLSSENIRRIGDVLEKKGLGRPSSSNLRELQYLILADEPDFLYEWRRDERSASNQLRRLNSLLLQDLIPKLQSARDSWVKYMYDSYYGWGNQLIDRPEDVSNKRMNTSLEFNNRFF